MADTFNVGDLVELKSGSPTMTVVSVGSMHGAPSVGVSWFDGTDFKNTHFPIDALKAASNPSDRR